MSSHELRGLWRDFFVVLVTLQLFFYNFALINLKKNKKAK